MLINIIALLLIIAFWLVGGQIKNGWRDIPCPIILGIAIAVKLWSPMGCLLAFLSIGAVQIIRLGYGNYDEKDLKPSLLASITHDRNGWWIRLIWGLLVGILTPLFLVKLLGWWYPVYIGINGAVNFLVSRLRLSVFLADTLVASAFGSILFFPVFT